MKLVEIYLAPDEAIARMLQGVLRSKGVKSAITPSESGGAFRGRFGGAVPPFDPWMISVPEAGAEKAKEILKSVANSGKIVI